MIINIRWLKKYTFMYSSISCCRFVSYTAIVLVDMKAYSKDHAIFNKEHNSNSHTAAVSLNLWSVKLLVNIMYRCGITTTPWGKSWNVNFWKHLSQGA